MSRFGRSHRFPTVGIGSRFRFIGTGVPIKKQCFRNKRRAKKRSTTICVINMNGRKKKHSSIICVINERAEEETFVHYLRD